MRDFLFSDLSFILLTRQVSGWEDKWKLITVQLFGNDICVSSCGEGGADYEGDVFVLSKDGQDDGICVSGDATPDGYKSNMKTALTILKSGLPKTLIVFTTPTIQPR